MEAQGIFGLGFVGREGNWGKTDWRGGEGVRVGIRERDWTDHVLVQEALLLQRFAEVALEFLVVGDPAGVVGWGDVLGH